MSIPNIKNLKYKFCCYDTVTLRAWGKKWAVIPGVLFLISDNMRAALMLNHRNKVYQK
jgi:hypothetical protein